MLTPPIDDGRDGLQVQVRRDDRVDRAEARAPEHADQAAKQAREDEHEGHVPSLVDAGEAGALRVAAERIEIAPGAGEARREAERQS